MNKAFNIAFTVFLLFLTAAAFGATDSSRPLWLRYPAVSPDGTQIAFTYGGQVWRVPAQGGDAVPLTSSLFYDSRPVWSPDGEWIAFASNRHGNDDVFITSAQGGEIRRLTYHSSNDVPYAFSRDGSSVYFYSTRLGDANEVHGGHTLGLAGQLWSVPSDGGRERLVIPVPALNVDPSADGQHLLYENQPALENEWRKHATSTATRDIWVFDTADGSHRRVTTWEGEDRDPMWNGDDSHIVYLSERSGSFNVWRRPLDGSAEPEQVTRHAMHPVRFLSRSDSGDLVYGFDGEIWRLPAGAGESARVDVRVTQGSMLGGSFFTSAKDDISEIVASADGSQVAIVARGEIFVIETATGKSRRITTTPEHERDISFSPDGRSILFAGQRDGDWDIFQATIGRAEAASFPSPGPIVENKLIESDTDVLQPAYSPDGKRIAFLDDRSQIRILDRETGETTTVLGEGLLFSYHDNDLPFTWSPDGNWLAATTGSAASQFEIHLVDAHGNNPPVNITRSGFIEANPVFSPDGRVIFFASDRAGLRTADFAAAEGDVYAIFLSQEAFDTFKAPLDAAVSAAGAAETSGSTEGASTGEDETWQPEFEGIERRVARITPFSGAHAYFAPAPDGKSLIVVSLSATTGLSVLRINLGRPGIVPVASKPSAGAHFVVDSKGQNLFFQGPGGIERIALANGQGAPLPFAAEIELDARAEMNYLFQYAWRQTQQRFYRPDMHRVDWDAYGQAYARYLPHISHWEDFAVLLSEMAGELNASHMGSRYTSPATYGDATAALGLYYDHAYAGPGTKIVDVLPGGPADRADSHLKPGAVILSVDGESIAEDMDIHHLLNHKAGTAVLLEIQPADGTDAVDQIVTPVPWQSGMSLAYQRWVESRRAQTEVLSNGRLGYVHIPLMNTASYQQFYATLFSGDFTDKEGLVVDVRFNGGGHLTEQLIGDLSAQPAGTTIGRDGEVFSTLPESRWAKPSILIANAASYSDGSIFPHLYKQAGIGSFVGEPVPGTGTSVWWMPLLSGGKLTYGIPEIGKKDNSGNWFENTQDDPDILVLNDPDSVEAGRDPQLQKAVETLLQQLP